MSEVVCRRSEGETIRGLEGERISVRRDLETKGRYGRMIRAAWGGELKGHSI